MTRIKYRGIEIDEHDPDYITEFSKTLVDGFYKREDETVSQALSRPAIAFCQGDYEFAQRIYDYAAKGWFMYAGRVLSNSQRGSWVKKDIPTDWRTHDFIAEEKFYGQPINCFAFNVPDTAKGQVSVIQELAELCMMGGGTAAHMDIRGIGGKAVGPIPYMKMMDSAIAYFQQGKSKRAALAAYLDVNHPDIIEHIRFRTPGGDTKRRSDNRKQFHVAVNITDEFIKAVQEDLEYELKCPHTKRVYEKLNARKVWEEILETRALTGEPFLLKIDSANRNLPQSQKDLGLEIRGSNLCVAPETVVLTRKGHIAIEELAGHAVDVWNGQEWSNVEVVRTGQGQKLISVKTSSGFDLDCTEYHNFYVMEGNRRDGKIVQVKAKDLKKGDKLIKFETPVIQGNYHLDKAYQNGFYSGDGCFVKGKSRVYLYGEKRNLREMFTGVSQYVTQEKQDREYFNVSGLQTKFFVPDSEYSVKSRLEWFAGLLDSDGCVTRNNESQNLQVASTEVGFLQSVQLMLQTLGVQSKVVFARDAGKFQLPANDGTGELKYFDCKSVNRLLVNGVGIVKLKALGLETYRLKISDHIPNRDARGFVKVEAVVDNGRVDDTYCFTEQKRGMGVFNGILTGQCSEILLPTNSERSFVCCLSSLNLEKFDEWKNSTIVEDLVRFLDNVLQSFIDLAPDTISRAKYSAARERAIGIGAMGYHGYLQSKGIPFEGGGFNSSVQQTNILFKHITERGIAGSRQLAIERGEPEDMKGTGLRNSRLFALAPNANNSDLLNTSPTIEPYFRNIFLKSTKAGNFIVKNMHLAKVLQKYEQDTEEVWKSIKDNEGRVTHLDFLTDHEKLVFKVAMEIDQHWIVELAEHRGAIMGVSGQAQSLNLYFPFGSSKRYVNSVHLKFLKNENVYTLYYYRSEREGNSDNAKAIERIALVDWADTGECLSCEG